MTRFLIVRHAQSEWNAQGRFQGRADPSLSELGREQARSAAAALAGFQGVLASSTLRRALETAEAIGAALGLGPIVTDARLAEIDTGDWTGLTREEIERGWPEEVVAWQQRRLPGYPGGETRVAHWERIRAALGHLAEAHPGAEVLVVSHGGVLGSIERALGALTDQGYPQLTGRRFTLNGETLEPGDRIELLAD